MDVDRIREALGWWFRVESLEEEGAIATLQGAARRVVEAREVWWCETHQSGLFVATHTPQGCDWYRDRPRQPCVMVPARLLVPPKESE